MTFFQDVHTYQQREEHTMSLSWAVIWILSNDHDLDSAQWGHVGPRVDVFGWEMDGTSTTTSLIPRPWYARLTGRIDLEIRRTVIQALDTLTSQEPLQRKEVWLPDLILQ